MNSKAVGLIATVFMLAAGVLFVVCSMYHFGKVEICPQRAALICAAAGTVAFAVSSGMRKSEDKEENKNNK